MSVALDQAFPLKIAKTSTTKLGGERFANERIMAQVAYQSIVDVRSFIQVIAHQQIEEQKAIGNPPQVVSVDGEDGKAISEVDKKLRILFGTTLASAAMREVEAALASAIARSTTARTGRLQDVAGSWGWWLVLGGGAARRVSAGQELGVFGPGDRVVLAPLQVPYATITNRNVAHSGRANITKGKGWKVAKRQQSRGFLYWAAETVRHRPAFALFNVKVIFSRAHMVPGELMSRSHGTGMLVITPKVRRFSAV